MKENLRTTPSRRKVLTALAAAGVGTVYAGEPTRADPDDALWAFETGDSVSSSPTVVDGTVFVGSDDNNVYALDANTGDKKWAFETGDWVQSSPTVVDETVYIGSRDQNVYALDANSGEKKWAFDTGNWVLPSSPSVMDGTVYVGNRDGNVYALDAASGEQKWVFETDNWVYSSPTVADGTVYIGSLDNNLYALDADTGEEKWTFGTPLAGFLSAPTLLDGTLYAGNGNNNLYALDAVSGEEEWTFETGDTVRTTPTVADGTVYAGSHDEKVYAVEAATGEEEWSYDTGGLIYSSPTVAGGTVYVGSNISWDPNMYALDADSGEEQWTFETGDFVTSSPTVVDGTVFVGSHDSHVYALEGNGSASSEGSRVARATLGHHHSWANTSDQSLDTNEADEEQDTDRGDVFDPRVHGFGFENWSGETFTAEDGEEYTLEYDRITRDEIRDELDEWPIEVDTRSLWGRGPTQGSILTGIIYLQTNMFAGAGGHCFGMVALAYEYYQNPSALPEDIESASEIPRPANGFDEVGNRIRALQAEHLKRYPIQTVIAALTDDEVTIDTETHLKEIINAVDSNGAAPLLLHDDEHEGDSSIHQAIVYGYEESDQHGTTTLYLYDPERPADSWQRDAPDDLVFEDPLQTLRVETDTGAVIDPHTTGGEGNPVYADYAYLPLDDVSANRAEELAGEPASIEEIFDGIVAKLFSPATMELIGPDGEPVTELSHPRADTSQIDAHEVIISKNSPPGDYTIELTGKDDGGEYSLEVEGISRGGGVLDYEETGTIAPGETKTITLTLPEESDDDIDWLPIAGAGAGIAGVASAAYWYLNRDDDGQGNIGS